MIKYWKYVHFIFIFLIINSCSKKQKTIVFYNAKIYTIDSMFSLAEAMVLADGKIIEIGTNKFILEKYKNAKDKIDIKSKFIYPGFIDAHCHFTGYAYNKQYVHLENTNSWKEVVEELKKYSQENKNNWIIGRGWDNTKWKDKNFPTNKDLNILFPNTPVAIRRIDGHAVLCNDTMLRLAKITDETKIDGGQIILENNKPTGVLIDNAMEVVLNLFPKISEEKAIRFFDLAQKDCFELGLTGVVDCGIEKETFEQLQLSYKKNILKIRITVLLSDNKENYEVFLNQKPYKDNF